MGEKDAKGDKDETHPGIRYHGELFNYEERSALSGKGRRGGEGEGSLCAASLATTGGGGVNVLTIGRL